MDVLALEIWCNEAQERYVLIVADDRIDEFVGLCDRERCPVSVIGTLTDDGRLVAGHPGEVRRALGQLRLGQHDLGLFGGLGGALLIGESGDEAEIPAQWLPTDYNWRVSLPGGGHGSPVDEQSSCGSQNSVPLQNNPSSQEVPAATGVLIQPPAGSHESSVQGLPSSQG